MRSNHDDSTNEKDGSTTVRATVASLPSAKADDRRGKRRAKISQPVRVRPSEPIANGFDEVLATIDMCRDGIYFATARDSYHKHLRLFITLPYHDHPGAIHLEYIGEVVRVDRLPDGKFGVAVHLLMSMSLKSHSTDGCINYNHS